MFGFQKKLKQKSFSFLYGYVMKKIGEVRLFLSFLVVAVLVVAMDVMLMPILVRFYLQAGIALVLIYDFSVVLMAGCAGVFLA